MINKLLTRVFGSRNERLLKAYERNVARINDSSNEVATGADHTAKACPELSQLAAGLRQSMGRFRLA